MKESRLLTASAVEQNVLGKIERHPIVGVTVRACERASSRGILRRCRVQIDAAAQAIRVTVRALAVRCVAIVMAIFLRIARIGRVRRTLPSGRAEPGARDHTGDPVIGRAYGCVRAKVLRRGGHHLHPHEIDRPATALIVARFSSASLLPRRCARKHRELDDLNEQHHLRALTTWTRGTTYETVFCTTRDSRVTS